MRLSFSSRILLTCVAICGVAFTQSSHQVRSIVINDNPGHVTVYQIDGKSYVDIESLVHIANGTMNMRGDQIILNIPDTQRRSSNNPPESAPEMSTNFVNSALETVANLKEWTDALAFAVQKGVPGDGSRVVVFQNRAQRALQLTRAAATTAPDQQALPLLTNHFDTVQKWSDKLISERRSLNTGKYSVSADAINNDESYQKISSCAAFLNEMLPTGKFQDSRFCH